MQTKTETDQRTKRQGLLKIILPAILIPTVFVGVLLVATKKAKPPTKESIAQNSNTTPIPTQPPVVVSECTNYINGSLKVSLTCPTGWFTEGPTNGNYVRLENYHPAKITWQTTMYNPEFDKGRYRILLSQDTNWKGIRTIAKLKPVLAKQEEGFDISIKVKNQEEAEINGYQALYRQIIQNGSQFSLNQTLLLDGNGNVVSFILDLDTEGGEKGYKQILSSVKFL